MPFSEALKLSMKRRAHFSCCLCHTLGVEVHHIVPRADGGSDDEDNAAPLCPTCHETYGANPIKRKFIRAPKYTDVTASFRNIARLTISPSGVVIGMHFSKVKSSLHSCSWHQAAAFVQCAAMNSVAGSILAVDSGNTTSGLSIK